MQGWTARRDIWGGILVMVLGIGSIAEGERHTIGSLTEMGSGYFPVVLGGLLSALGLVIAIGGLTTRPADSGGFTKPDWRGCAAIIGGLALFVLLGAYAGLAPATFACVFVAALGDRKSTYFGAATLALVMTAIAAGVFVYLLQVQFPILRF